jgi:hypothetical protein
MFSPYSRLRRENQQLIPRLVNSGKAILLASTNVDEEGLDEDYVSFFNKRLFPHLSTAALVKRSISCSEQVARANNEYYANKGGLAFLQEDSLNNNDHA